MIDNKNAIDRRTAPLGAFILRVSLGVMFLAHALVLKLGAFGLDGTTQFFVSIGLPAWTAYNLATRDTMVFDLPPRLAQDPQKAQRLVWANS